jgi:hypothetical protein
MIRGGADEKNPVERVLQPVVHHLHEPDVGKPHGSQRHEERASLHKAEGHEEAGWSGEEVIGFL